MLLLFIFTPVFAQVIEDLAAFFILWELVSLAIDFIFLVAAFEPQSFLDLLVLGVRWAR